MSNFMHMNLGPFGGIIGNPPATPRGRMHSNLYASIYYARYATDSIGNMTMTLTNLVVGSAIRIEIQSTGALVEFRTATLATEVFTVPVYSGGSASNDVRIKVRKASTGTAYIPYQTLVTAVIGTQSIYVSQVQDE